MTAFVLRDFGGRVPITADRLLADNAASEATNIKLLSGELKGINAPGLLYSFAPGSPAYEKALHVDYNGQSFWFGLTDPESDIVRCPLINDAYGRFYMVDPPGSLPRLVTQAIIAAGGTPLLLGVPAPPNPPTVTPAAITGLTGEIVETRSYVYTYTTAFGEESAPSPAASGSGDSVNAWTISNMTIVVDNPTQRNIAGVNLYRTVTGTNGTAFYLVASFDVSGYGSAAGGVAGAPELIDSDTSLLTDYDGAVLVNPATAGGTTTVITGYNDSTPDTTLIYTDIQLPSTYWLPPLAMDGIISHPMGFLVGWKGNNIYASAIGYPHAWPNSYALAIDSKIIGMAVWGTNIIVCTDTTPRQLSGVSPDSLTLFDYEIKEPCQSKNSIVAFPPQSIMYASENGIVMVDWLGVHLATNQLMSRDVFTANYNPTRINAVRQNTQYLAFTENGGGFIFDNQSPRLGFVDLVNQLSPSVTVDYGSGDAIIFNNNTAYRWNDLNQPQMPYRWKSKIYYLPSACSFGICRVDLDDVAAEALSPTNLITDPLLPNGVPLRIRIYAAASETNTMQVVWDQNITASGAYRLPSGFKSYLWQFEFIGQVTMYDFKVAETGRELAKI